MKTFVVSLFALALAGLAVYFAAAESQNATVTAQAIGGPVFVSGDDAEDHCDELNCGGLMVAVLNSAIDLSLSPGTGIAAIGMEDPDNTAALNSWNDPGNGGPNVPITVISEAEIPTVDFADYAVIFVPSNETDDSDPVGIDNSELVALNARKADIQAFVNELGGGLIALTEEDADPALAWGFFPLSLVIEEADYTQAQPTPALLELAPAATLGNMTHDSWHEVFTGPPGYSGLEILATAVDTEDPSQEGSPALLGGARVILTGRITLTPETATNVVGEDHTVTAHVTDGVAPVEGESVAIEVTDGPNAGDSGSSTTDADGNTTFTYTGDGGEGTDTIEACVVEEAPAPTATPEPTPTAEPTPQPTIVPEEASAYGAPSSGAFVMAGGTGTLRPGVAQQPQEQEDCDTATKTWQAAPTATAVAEVVELPTTGGSPADGGSSFAWLLAALAGSAALLAAAGWWLARRPTR